MHVIFVEPAFPFNQREFVRGLVEVGAQVTGIGERPIEFLDDELKGWLSGYEQVSSVVNEEALQDAVRKIQRRGWVDLIEGTVEAHIMSVARAREATGIPGTSVRTAFLCRDKPAMKQVLREAGVPCAQSTGASSIDEVLAFADTVGYPLIIKPPDGAGAAGTSRVENEQELRAACTESGVDQGATVAVEEFIEGHEGFYDTISIDGEPACEFVCHYYPNVLHGMRTRWVSPQIVATNRVDLSSYDEVKAMGRKVIKALGIGTSPTHQEWFISAKGLKFSEIGCRPPGVGAWDLYSSGNDMDLYREWAHAIVHGKPETPPSRRFSAGMIALRPDQDGEVIGTEGADDLLSDWGEHMIDHKFPAPGTPTQPVEGGFMANAWVRMRHTDFDTLRTMLDTVGEKVQLRAR